MRPFERKGIDRQYESVTVTEANRNYSISCHICATHNMITDCDRCGINFAHELVVEILTEKNNKREMSNKIK